MKKLLAITLALLMMLSMMATAFAESADTTDTADKTEPTHITVGTTSKLSGHFFSEKWGANSADIDIRELIHGHNTISWEQTGNYALNSTVIKELSATENTGNGDKTYTIALNEGLMYNDGTPINAYDYAFSALLLSSPEFNALGGAPTSMEYYVGYDAYQEGNPFSGVRVVDELTLELTLDGQYLPFYYEVMLLNLIPYPIHVIAPGCEVKDDGQGAYIDGDFTTELLQDTILNEETGYLYKPYVTAGAYKFVSYDTENHSAEFTKNELYNGNFEGVIPTISGITVVYAESATALDEIESGKLDMVNKISDGAIIMDGMGRVAEGTLSQVSYLRTGMSFISFACELGATQSVNVRKALALSIDVNAVNIEFTQGQGVPVYGYYGMGQWMAMQHQTEMAEFAKMPDPNAAIDLLVADGWTLNENGEAYDEQAGGTRYRLNENGELEGMILKWAQSQESAMSDLLAVKMMEHADTIGVELEITKLPFDELLKHYYRQVDREYNMFSLATNFNLAFDPYETFHTGEEYQGEANTTGLQDEELMNLALAMRQTPVGDDEAYAEKWLAFQARWNELQPMIPLYCNIYYDYFRPDLQEFDSNAYVSWATAVVYAYIGEPKVDELSFGDELTDLDDVESADDLEDTDELLTLD